MAMSALRKILVVDDDPVVGKSFNRVLSGKGYAVITARDGPEALKRLAEGEYDAVFTDIRMPGMDGIEVAERVKARRPWTPVVIITGYGTEDNEARAKAAGVSEFLRKPLSPEMIEGSARNALHVVPMPAAPAAALLVPRAPTGAEAGRKGVLRRLELVALMLAAPMVALAYVVAAPFVGLGMLLWMGLAAAARTRVGRRLRNGALMVAMPFVGLAYAIALPFVGLAALAVMAVRSAVASGAARGAGRFAGNVALFFAAPFIGLAYALAFPFIGFVLLVKAMRKTGTRE
jgi:CheY-like chemotaxis protein